MHNNGPPFGKTLRSETLPLQDASIPTRLVPRLLGRANRPLPVPRRLKTSFCGLLVPFGHLVRVHNMTLSPSHIESVPVQPSDG
jgi:hypothetical protein